MFGELSASTPARAPQAPPPSPQYARSRWNRDRPRGHGSLIAPKFAEQLLRVLARRYAAPTTSPTSFFTDVPGRVAKLLLQLAQRFGTQDEGAPTLSPTT